MILISLVVSITDLLVSLLVAILMFWPRISNKSEYFSSFFLRIDSSRYLISKLLSELSFFYALFLRPSSSLCYKMIYLRESTVFRREVTIL